MPNVSVSANIVAHSSDTKKRESRPPRRPVDILTDPKTPDREWLRTFRRHVVRQLAKESSR